MMTIPLVVPFLCICLGQLTSTTKTNDQPRSPVDHMTAYDTVVYLPEHAKIRYRRQPHFRPSATILFWSTLYGSKKHWFWWFNDRTLKDTCPGISCKFTDDESKLNESDAVLFNVYGKDFNLRSPNIKDLFPPYRLPHQRWVFYSSEPPSLSQSKSSRLSKLDGLFNWTMTFRRDADIYAHFGKLILTRNRTAVLERDYSIGKTKLAVWFVSHCDTEGHREDYVKELQKSIEVDVYGICGPFKCQPPRSKQCYDEAALKYKFYLSFENVLCRDYVSEKFTKVMAADIVPIVFGGSDYSQYAPPGSYIDALQFESPTALADYLVYLDKNPTEYNRFFDWKRGYDVTLLRTELYICELCLNLMDPNLPTKTYHDLDDWWNRQAECTGWNPSPNSTTSNL